MNRIYYALALILIATSDGKPVVTAITPENAEKVLPHALVIQHCALLDYTGECNARDFVGVAVDLNGNGAPEFSISDKKIAPGASRCYLYHDEKEDYRFIQKNFPCDIEPKERRTEGWADIAGTVYPTGCEPLRCEFTWTGSIYKEGTCVPVKEGACGIE